MRKSPATANIPKSWLDDVSYDEVKIAAHAATKAVLMAKQDTLAISNERLDTNVVMIAHQVVDGMLDEVTRLPNASVARAKLDSTSLYESLKNPAPDAAPTEHRNVYQAFMSGRQGLTSPETDLFDKAVQEGLKTTQEMLANSATLRTTTSKARG